MNYHSLRRRSRGISQSLPKHIVTLVADANPVDRAQDDRLAGAQHNHAATAQADFTLRLDQVIGHHAAHGWGGVHIEHGQPQTFGPAASRRWRQGRRQRAMQRLGGVDLHQKDGRLVEMLFAPIDFGSLDNLFLSVLPQKSISFRTSSMVPSLLIRRPGSEGLSKTRYSFFAWIGSESL